VEDSLRAENGGETGRASDINVEKDLNVSASVSSNVCSNRKQKEMKASRPLAGHGLLRATRFWIDP